MRDTATDFCDRSQHQSPSQSTAENEGKYMTRLERYKAEIEDLMPASEVNDAIKKKKRRQEEKVAVVNANGDEGASIVRTLAKKGFQVVAIVRVATSKHALSFMRIKNVTVEVADSRFDADTISELIKGCKKVFFVTKFWEQFADKLEETQAFTIFKACGEARARKVIFTTYEDVRKLTQKGQKSQIISYGGDGKKPKFDGMKDAKKYAKSLNIHVVHMITSYLNQETSKKSLCMIANGKGDLIVRSKF